MPGFAPGCRLVAAALALVAVPLRAAPVEAPCFTAADNTRLPFAVFQQAPPPSARARRYDYYPLTAAATMQLGRLADAAGGTATYYFQWANRSNAPFTDKGGRPVIRKPNIQPSIAGMRKQRTPFTSVARADACTLAQAATLLGQGGKAAVTAFGAGITYASETAQSDNGLTGPADRCVLPEGLLPAGAGLMLDYEVSDGRSAAQTLEFLTKYAQLVHGAGRKAFLMIDPFDAPSQRFGGISAANANAIVSRFDHTAIMLWSKNRQGSLAASYAAQRAMIAAGGQVDPQRLIINFELAGTTLDDARFVRRTILTDRLAGVMFWRNRVRQGGSCSTDVNRKIAEIVFGRSSGEG